MAELAFLQTISTEKLLHLLHEFFYCIDQWFCIIPKVVGSNPSNFFVLSLGSINEIILIKILLLDGISKHFAKKPKTFF